MEHHCCFLHHHPPTSTTLPRLTPTIKPTQLICRSQKAEINTDSETVVSRRLALTVLIGAAAIGTKAPPANAAYGEAANVFGKPKSNTDFLPYNGDGFKLLLPAKWNASKEREFPGQVLRYEDNFDPASNVSVIITETDKKTIKDFGTPEEFLSKVDYLLGKQASPLPSVPSAVLVNTEIE